MTKTLKKLMTRKGWKTVYKVVAKGDSGHLQSVRGPALGKYERSYGMGIPTYAIGKAKLFVFRRRRDAERFQESNNRWDTPLVITRGLAKNVQPLEFRALVFLHDRGVRITGFWDTLHEKFTMEKRVKTPAGTYCCDIYEPQEILD